MPVSSDSTLVPGFSPDPSRPLKLLAACPAYSETPLLRLENLGPWTLLGKDESARMGLGSFKALGGVYAVAAMIAAAWSEAGHGELDVEEYLDESIRNFAGGLTFVCASAGNHGMSIAAGAQIFGARARVHLAASVPEYFARRLRDRGADVVRSGDNYEDSVVAALADADASDAILLSDSSWPGYRRAPSLIMEGYSVIAEELRRRFELEHRWPSHVFLQAGVGGLAAAIAHMIRLNWTAQPEIIIVEPEAAPCLLQSQLAGKPVTVAGPESVMARLDCKQPSIIAVEVLNRVADRFVTIGDAEAEDAVAIASSAGIKSTPSGVAGLAALLNAEELGLELDGTAYPLVIITEAAA